MSFICTAMFLSRLFKKKQPQTTPTLVLANLPALNAWGIFFQGNGITLYSRSAATVPGMASDFVYLKSYPEVFELERKLFAEWLATSSTGVYLQQWDDKKESRTLVYVSFTDPALTVIKTGITTANWASGYEDGKPVIIFKYDSGINESYVIG